MFGRTPAQFVLTAGPWRFVIAIDRMQAAASQLATQVTEAEEAGRRRSWRKVTTLLAAFGVGRLTPAARAAVGAALDEAGLTCEPAMEVVSRADTVRISRRIPSPRQPIGAVAASNDIPLDDAGVVTSSRWFTGALPQDGAPGLPTLKSDGSLLLLEVDPNAEPLETLYERLAQYCGSDLRIEMVEDLLEADAIPKVTVRPDWRARVMSTFGVEVHDEQRQGDDRPENRDVSKAGTLVFQPVEFIVGPSWLIVCWHNSLKIFPGGAGTDRVGPDGDPILRDGVMSQVDQRWSTSSRTSPGDLALLISLELARTYESAQAELSAWMDQWETAFEGEEAMETETLGSVRRAVQEYRSRVQGLDLAKHSAPDRRWFPDLSTPSEEAELSVLLKQTSSSLDSVARTVGSGMELVMMTRMAEQLRVSHKAGVEASSFQDTLTVLGAILLGPGLVAAIYGANVDLPGRDRLLGTLILIVGMVTVSLISFAVLRYIQGVEDGGSASRRRFGLPQLFLNPWRGMNAEFAQIRGERPKRKPDHVEAV